MNTRQRLSSSFPELWYSLLEFNSRNIRQHLTNWTSWNKRDNVWSSANSLYKWRFRSNRHLCCLSSLATVWPATVQNWNKSFTHIKNRAWAVGREYLVNEIPFLSGFQSSLLFIHFRYGPNIRSHCIIVWHRTYPIYDIPLSRSARRTFTLLQNCAKILVFANKRECCKLTCGISRQETRSHMEVYRTYFKWVEFEILGSSLSLAWEIRLSKGTHLRHNPLLWYTNLIC